MNCLDVKTSEGTGSGHLGFVSRLQCVLSISQESVDAVVAHARRVHPIEACGVVAGIEGSDHAARCIEMSNAADSATFYEFESGELLALYRDMDARGEGPVVIYHSHTTTAAYPSPTDVRLASEPHAHYVVISTREHGNRPGPVEFRSYRIRDGVVTEDEILIHPEPRRT